MVINRGKISKTLMICHGNKSNAHLGLWSLQGYKFGAAKNVDFFFILQIFSRVLKVFIKSFYPWPYSAKNKLFRAGQGWV